MENLVRERLEQTCEGSKFREASRLYGAGNERFEVGEGMQDMEGRGEAWKEERNEGIPT